MHIKAKPFYSKGKYNILKSKLRFGVELETSACPGYEKLDGQTCFHSKDDGSIDGLEFVSEQLYGDDGLAAIDEFCRAANDFEVDVKCGFHLHIGVSRLPMNELKEIVTAYNLHREWWFKLVPPSRQNNQYCMASQNYIYYDNLSDFKAYCEEADRRKWLNINAFAKHGTFEIRLHSGTLCATKIKNWVRLHLTFVEYARKHGSDDIDIDNLFDYDLLEYCDKRREKFTRQLSGIGG